MSTNDVQVHEHDGAPAVAPDTVHYRVIADNELLLLKPLFERLGWALPDPDFAKAVVAEIGDGPSAIIAGFAIVQFVTHAEPMWIDMSLRGTGIAEGLSDALTHYIEHDCHIKRYVCMAKPGSFGAKLAARNGMTIQSGDIYVKQLP